MTKTLSGTLAKSKFNIQLEKFNTEGIAPLEKAIEERRNAGYDVRDIEYRHKVYVDLYNMAQRLLYAHAVFVFATNKFHNKCKDIGFINSDNQVTFDCMEQDVSEAYELIQWLVDFYEKNNDQYVTKDEVSSLLKGLHEASINIGFE